MHVVQIDTYTDVHANISSYIKGLFFFSYFDTCVRTSCWNGNVNPKGKDVICVFFRVGFLKLTPRCQKVRMLMPRDLQWTRVCFFLIPCNQRAAWIGVRAWECVFGQEGGQDGGFSLLHRSSGHSGLKLRPSSTFMRRCRQTLALKRALSKWQCRTISKTFL